MLSKHSIENKVPKNFQVNNKKSLKNYFKNIHNLTVFEPKNALRFSGGTYAVPRSKSATFNIKCLKCELKDIPICLDSYFQPKKIN